MLSEVLEIRCSLQQIPQPALSMMTRSAAAQGWLKKHFFKVRIYSRWQVQIWLDTNLAGASSYKFLLSFHQTVCSVFLSKCLAVTRPTTDNHFSLTIDSKSQVPGDLYGGSSPPRVNFLKIKALLLVYFYWFGLSKVYCPWSDQIWERLLIPAASLHSCPSDGTLLS